jgi:radical SAM protein with 4Fe4S-binding SPASM domain
MGLNLQNPDLTSLLRREQVISLIEELMWVKENLGMDVDIFEAMPKCVFPAWIKDKNPYFMRRKCQAGRTIVSVANNGDVRPCSHNPDVYGNILQEPLEAIWARMGEWRDHQRVPNRCVTCKLEAKCHGGCRITAKAYTGDCKGEDPWMDTPILSTGKSTGTVLNVVLEPEMTLVVFKMFRWRKENGEEYLITSTRNSRNATIVNKQLFEFVSQLRDRSPITLEDIVKAAGCNFDDVEFQRVIKLLVNREFITLQSGRKEVNAHV